MLHRLVVALSLALCAGATPPPALAAEPARFLTSYVWDHEQVAFGGYSGIEISDDGREVILLSDRAHLVRGTITRHQDRILGLVTSAAQPLEIAEGLLGDDPEMDSEGLALLPDGTLLVSLESDNRVLRFGPGQPAQVLPSHPEIDAFATNAGAEALALTPEGAPCLTPEKSGALTAPFPLFCLQNGGWRVTALLPRRGGFLPTGADFDAKGRLYLLERAFDGLGFSSRVRRFTPGNSPDDGLAEETLLTTPTGEFDNLEGLAVWTGVDGRLRLTMISDDNFFPLQRTEIVEFALPD